MEKVDRSCGECWEFLKRRYGAQTLLEAINGNKDLDGLKPKEPVGWMWLMILMASAILALLAGGLAHLALNEKHLTYGLVVFIVAMFAEVGISVIVLYGFVCFFEFLFHDVIGYPMFVCRDGAGRLHTHLREPMLRKGGNDYIANYLQWIKAPQSDEPLKPDDPACNHLVRGPLLKLRVGGWFRMRWVRGTQSRWSITRCWRGHKDVRFADGNGGEIGLPDNTTAEKLLDVCELLTVDAALWQVKAFEQAQADHKRRVEEFIADTNAAKRLADLLGVAIVGALARMDRDRKALGRSEHAKRLRLYFEDVLAQLYRDKQWKDLPQTWRDEAMRQFAAEPTPADATTVPAPTAPAAPPSGAAST